MLTQRYTSICGVFFLVLLRPFAPLAASSRHLAVTSPTTHGVFLTEMNSKCIKRKYQLQHRKGANTSKPASSQGTRVSPSPVQSRARGRYPWSGS